MSDENSLLVVEGPWSKELVKDIAADIGSEIVAHIETMYPAAINATPSTFRLSVRNKVFNEIMAAISVNDAGEIAARLKDRKAMRRKIGASYRKMRGAS